MAVKQWTMLDSGIMVLYFVMLILVGVYYSRKNKNSEDFLVAGRSVGFLRLTGSITAGDIGGGYVLGTIGAAYVSGFGASWLIFGSLLGMWAVGFFLAPRLKPLADKVKFLTMAQFLGYRYDTKSRLVGSIVTVFATMTFVGTQILTGAILISAITGWPKEITAFIAGGVVIIYTSLGGLSSLVVTDVIQAFIIMGGLYFIAVPTGISAVGGFSGLIKAVDPSLLSMGSVAPGTVIKWLLSVVPAWLISSVSWQYIFSAKDTKTVKKSYITSGLLMWPIFAFFMCLLGIISNVLIPGVKGEMAFPIFITTILPAGVTGIIIAAVAAAVTSTADNQLMSTSSTITNDIYRPFINPKATDRQIVIMSKSLIIIAGFCSLLTALYSPLLLNLMLKGYQFNSAMFWPVILGLFWKKATATAAFWSLLVGGIGSVIWNLIGSPFGWPSIYLAFPLTLIMMVFISLSSKHAAEENIISADSASESVTSM